MSTAPSNDPNARYVPPDPGGRSRFLLRGIVIACIVGAVIAAVLMLGLRQAAPPATPQQQPDKQSFNAPASAQEYCQQAA